jgi:hypothetical protein
MLAFPRVCRRRPLDAAATVRRLPWMHSDDDQAQQFHSTAENAVQPWVLTACRAAPPRSCSRRRDRPVVIRGAVPESRHRCY